MSIGGVELSYDLNARSLEADLLQAQYFHHVLTAHQEELAANLATHSARFGHAERARDRSRLQSERREIQALESQVRKLAVMIQALQSRFPGIASDRPTYCDGAKLPSLSNRARAFRSTNSGTNSRIALCANFACSLWTMAEMSSGGNCTYLPANRR